MLEENTKRAPSKTERNKSLEKGFRFIKLGYTQEREVLFKFIRGEIEGNL